MSKVTKVVVNIALAIIMCFISIGYASISDTLTMHGAANLTPPDYDEIIVTEVTVVSGTTINKESHSIVVPTNVKSTITGSSGQKIVYKIKAHNYSETLTYVYTGTYCDSLFADVSNKMSISASTDANGANRLPNNLNAMSVSGEEIAPGEDFVFYAIYDLTSSVSAGEVLVHYSFKPIVYTITYLNENEIWAIDHIVDNSKEYKVRSDGPGKQGHVFVDWINANAVGVDKYPAGNTNSYTLSAKWDSMYLIMFVDEHGTVLYQEVFTSSSTALSAEGQREVNEILTRLQEQIAYDDMSVSWESYTIKGAKADIIVHPVYTYTGNIRYTPVDTDKDGITDYYQVDAVDKLDETTKIRGEFNNLPVKDIVKLYKNDDNFDYGSGVKRIEIGEGVTIIRRNALAYTSALTSVKLPSTIEIIEKNAFSRNFGNDKKKLTIEFNGTMAEWQDILDYSKKVKDENKEWHNGLQEGSRVLCSDGYYELERGFFGSYNWKSYKY
jgi:hypothetical protein